MPKAGETPGVGNFQCTKCGYIVALANATDKLPVCPKCRAVDYIKKK